MGSCHGGMGLPIGLEAMPEAWGEGKNRRRSSVASDTIPVKGSCKPREADLLKIDSVGDEELARTDNKTDNGAATDTAENNIIVLIDDNAFKKPAGESVSDGSRRNEKKGAATVSEESISLYGPIDVEGGRLNQPDHVVQAIKRGCRCTTELPTYSEFVFREKLRQVALIETNARLRIWRNVQQEAKDTKEQIAELKDDIQQLKELMERHGEVLKAQQQKTTAENDKRKPDNNQPAQSPPSTTQANTSRSIGNSLSNNTEAKRTRPTRIPVLKSTSGSSVLDMIKPVLAPALLQRLLAKQQQRRNNARNAHKTEHKRSHTTNHS